MLRWKITRFLLIRVLFIIIQLVCIITELFLHSISTSLSTHPFPTHSHRETTHSFCFSILHFFLEYFTFLTEDSVSFINQHSSIFSVSIFLFFFLFTIHLYILLKMSNIIDGKLVAESIKAEIKEKVQKMKEDLGKVCRHHHHSLFDSLLIADLTPFNP